MLATVKLIPNFPITDYKNVCLWSSNEARNNAIDSWNSGSSVTLNNVSTIDIDSGTFRCQLDYVDTLNFNYMYFTQNGRRFYCFIRDIEWVQNTKMCVVHFEIDYFTTFQKDLSYKKCLVVREHVEDDTFGKHTIDEGFNVSEYITHDYKLIDYTNFYVGIALSDSTFLGVTGPHGQPVPPVIRKTSTGYINATLIATSDSEIREYISTLLRYGKGNAIIGVYLQPTTNVDIVDGEMTFWEGDEALHYNCKVISPTTVATPHRTTTVSRPSSFGNNHIGTYTPKNKKCLCFPFSYCEVSNQNGNSTKLKFELSDNKNAITLKSHVPVGYNTSSYTYPEHYNNVFRNIDCSVVGGCNPQIPYNTSSYAQYWGANYNTIVNDFRNLENGVAIAGINGLLSAVGSGSGMGAVGTLPSTAMSLYNAYNNALNYEATLKDIENRPNETHGTFSGDASLLELEFGFKWKILQAKPEYIELIDNYFSMYGYKVSICKNLEDSLSTRPIFNYVQTDGANLTGSCPQVAINTIKKMFDSGVTVWHGLSNMFNYNFGGNIA